MDPDATLAELRELAKQINDGAWSPIEIRDTERAQLAEKFAALDLWLASGGYTPDAWRPRPEWFEADQAQAEVPQ